MSVFSSFFERARHAVPLHRSLCFSAVLLVACLGIFPAAAHHGPAVKFDTTTRLTISGHVTRVDWANPHAHVFMVGDGTDDDWYVELESPVVLEWNGWSEQTLQPGDRIRVEGFPARDGSPQIWGELVLQNGKPVFNGDTTALTLANAVTQERPVPRWPDGKPRLGAAAGEEGYWVPDTTVMMEEGVNVPMTSYGLLENIADAPRVAPFQDWALRLYEFRQHDFLRSDPSYVECRPPAGPRKFQVPFGIQLLEDRDWQRIFVVAAGGNQDWHIIYTDGRGINTGFEVDNDNLLYYGRLVADWEGDTLVVESEGFNEKFWLTGGIPHTSLMKTTERLTRSDFNTLRYEVTIDDPGAFTRPWQMSWNLVWKEGGDPPEYYCQDNRL